MLRLGGSGLGPPAFGSCGAELERPSSAGAGGWRTPFTDVESELCTLRTAVETSHRGLAQLEAKIANKLEQSCRRQVEDILASQGPLTEFRQTITRMQSEARHLKTEFGRLPSARDVDDALNRYKETLEARVGERVAALEEGIGRQTQTVLDRLEGRGGETWRTCLHRMASLEEKAVLQSDVASILDRMLSEVRKAGPELFGAGAITGPAALAETRREMRRIEAKLAGIEARLMGIAEDSTTEGRVWRANLAAKVEALERALQQHSGRRASEDAARLEAEESFRAICEAAETASNSAAEQARDAAAIAKRVASEAVVGLQASLQERVAALDAEGKSRDSANRHELKELSGRLVAQDEEQNRFQEKTERVEHELTQALNRLADLRADAAGFNVKIDAHAEKLREREAADLDQSRTLRDLRHDLQVQNKEVDVKIEEHRKHVLSSLERIDVRTREAERRTAEIAAGSVRTGAASPGATAASYFAANAAVAAGRQPGIGTSPPGSLAEIGRQPGAVGSPPGSVAGRQPGVGGSPPGSVAEPGRQQGVSGSQAGSLAGRQPGVGGSVASSAGGKQAGVGGSPHGSMPEPGRQQVVGSSPHASSAESGGQLGVGGSPAGSVSGRQPGIGRSPPASVDGRTSKVPGSPLGAVSQPLSSPSVAGQPQDLSSAGQAFKTLRPESLSLSAAASESAQGVSPAASRHSSQAAVAASAKYEQGAGGSPVPSEAGRSAAGAEAAKAIVPSPAAAGADRSLSSVSSPQAGGAGSAAVTPHPETTAPGVPQRLRFVSPTWQKECDGEYLLIEGNEPNGRPVWKKQDGERWLYCNTDKNWACGGPSEHEKGFNCKNGFIFNARSMGAASPDHLAGGWMLFDGEGWREDPDVAATPVQSATEGARASGSRPASTRSNAGALAMAALAGSALMQAGEGTEEPSAESAVSGQLFSPSSARSAGSRKQAIAPPAGPGQSPPLAASPADMSAIGAVTSFNMDATSLVSSPGLAGPGAAAKSSEAVISSSHPSAGAALADSVLAEVGAADAASEHGGGSDWDVSEASRDFDADLGGASGSLLAASPQPGSSKSPGSGGGAPKSVVGIAGASAPTSPPVSGRSRFSSLEPVREGLQAALPVEVAEEPGSVHGQSAGEEEDAPFDGSSDWDADGSASLDRSGPTSRLPEPIAPAASSVQRPSSSSAQRPPASKAASSARDVLADLGFDSEESGGSAKKQGSKPAQQPPAKVSAPPSQAPSSARDVMADLGFDSDEAPGAGAESDSNNSWD